jgi:hypothetical protein
MMESDLDDPEKFDKIESKAGICYKPKNYPGPIAIDIKPSEECKEYHENSTVEVEWCGILRSKTSDGRTVNIAEELNRLEREKNND